jgi:hypothetical protein
VDVILRVGGTIEEADRPGGEPHRRALDRPNVEEVEGASRCAELWHPALPQGARPAAPSLPPPPAAAPGLASRADLAARDREVERAEALGRLARRIVEAPALGLGWKRIEEGQSSASGPVVSVGWTLSAAGEPSRAAGTHDAGQEHEAPETWRGGCCARWGSLTSRRSPPRSWFPSP